MGEILETESSGKDQFQLSKDLLVAFEHAQSSVKDGEQPSRQLIRFTFDLMRAFISRLAVHSANAYEDESFHQSQLNTENDRMDASHDKLAQTKKGSANKKLAVLDDKCSKGGPDKQSLSYPPPSVSSAYETSAAPSVSTTSRCSHLTVGLKRKRQEKLRRRPAAKRKLAALTIRDSAPNTT